MLWVLSRSASQRHFYWVPTTCFFEKYLSINTHLQIKKTDLLLWSLLLLFMRMCPLYNIGMIVIKSCVPHVESISSPLFVCVEVLRPSQPNEVMSSTVSLPNHTFTGQALSSKRLTSIMHIPSQETDNCPSWISGRERMTVENISRSISTKKCCRPRRGLNPRPPGLQLDGASNWNTKAGKPLQVVPVSPLYVVNAY